MALDRNSSGEIVKELIRQLGEARVSKILNVTETRFKFLSNGRGCLTDLQLQCITDQTKQSWMRWGVDAGARHAKTAKDRAFVASAHRMWDEVEGKTNHSKIKKLHSRSAARLTPAVASV